MSHPALIVCEPSGLWTAALRQASTDEPLRLVETRRAGDVREHLAAAPASMVALAWRRDWAAEIAELTDEIGRRYPRARVVALLDRRQGNDEWLARELGAIHVCRSPRQVAVVVRLARRHLGRHAARRAWPAMHERIEEIWQTLPWNSEEGLEFV